VKSDILIYIDSAGTDEELSFGGSFIPAALAERCASIAGAGEVFYSIPRSYSGSLAGGANTLVRSGHDGVDFWKETFSRTGSEHLCKVRAESPFLDAAVIGAMIDTHLSYLAEFTFSENLPAGFSCEIVSRELIDAIPEFSEKTLPLSQVIKANINHFDVEIFYREPDIRDKRISFLTTSRRDRRVMEAIHKEHGIPSYAEVKSVIEHNPDLLYVGPSYLEIELTGRCDLDCLFCYRKTLGAEHGDMDPALAKGLFEQMKRFGLPYTVCFGGSGEPLMHRNFYEIASLAAAEPLVESVIVETNGLYADANYRNFIMDAGRKIRTIVNINGYNADTYQKLHGADRFEAVLQNILALAETARDRLHVQVMKINETEPFLDAYYDYWEKHKVQIILQKQNTFLGRIPDRRYSDLSPLERIPCWHLQRDLYITADGGVSFCKQDVDGACSPGNLGAVSLADIWETKKKDFVREYAKDYPSKPDCASCDEWYTFNF
jgi:spiro-SPASM protein